MDNDTTATYENPTVARAAAKADAFAALAARNPANRIHREDMHDRLTDWSPRTRCFTVEVTDATGQVTTASWTAHVDRPDWGNRSVRFFGWGYWPGFDSGRRIREDLARIRVSH